MKQLSYLLAVMVSILISRDSTFAQWVRTNQLCGGYFTSFAASGAAVFAGAYGGGIFLSTNDGANWKKLNLADGTWTNGLVAALDGSGGTDIFVAATWGAVGEPCGVIRSTDFGQTWFEVNSGLTNLFLTSLAVSVGDDGSKNLFAGTWGGGVFRSTNNGARWNPVNTGLHGLNVKALAVAGSTLLAGTDHGAFLSVNNGSLWTQVNSGLPDTNLSCAAISSVETGGKILFVGSYKSGAFRSSDTGASWVPANDGLNNLHVYALTPSPVGTGNPCILAGTNGGGIYRSTNNGVGWVPVNTGLTFPYIQGLAIIADGNGGRKFFAGTWGSGVFVSSDEGSSWTIANSGLVCRSVNALAAFDSKVFAGTNGCGAFLSTDGGATWNQNNVGMKFPNVYALAVVANEQGGTHLVAGAGGIYISSNGGATWKAANMAVGDVHAFAVSQVGNESPTIFAGNNALDLHQVQVIASTDRGMTWRQQGTNINASRLNALVTYEANLLVGTDNRGVLLTTDGGMTWIPRNNGLMDSSVSALTISTGSAGAVNVIAATGHGLFRSTDFGMQWTLVSGDAVSTQIQALAVSRQNMFAGVSSTVWKRPLSEVVTAVEDIRAGDLKSFSLSQNYPNPFNPATRIPYQLGSNSQVVLKIYDMLGRVVATFVNGIEHSGTHAVCWDASTMPTGVYFYRFEAYPTNGNSAVVETKRMVLLR
ncbi:MAG: T9SS type A sorting domain-containing protein [Ignavibacteriales bacterium]|nr:T9SS type A sorting domain-containing protein [Ignavibacteriales bacterium]